MRKILAVLALSFLTASAVFAKASDDQEFIIKVGFQPQATATFDGDKEDTNIGISAGLEYFKYFGNIIALGAGAVYDLPRKFKNDDVSSGNISFIPMYVGLKIRTPLHGLDNNYAFLSGRVGYSAFMNSDMNDVFKTSSGGLYYAAGVGISIDIFVLEAIYGVSNYSWDSATGKSYDDKYTTIGIYAGLKFE